MKNLTDILNYVNNWHRQLNPPIWWKTTRFFLNWLTLPIKISIIATLGLTMIIRNLFLKRNKDLTDSYDEQRGFDYYRQFAASIPLVSYRNTSIHALRVPAGQTPNGSNHNTDHQLARHGVFAAINQRTGNWPLSPPYEALYMHILYPDGQLVRGFKVMDEEFIYDVNDVDTSGDMLVGLVFGGTHRDTVTSEELLKISLLGEHIIDNDYAIKSHDKKSDVAMWEPGLFTVGAQAVTVLSALMFCYRKTGNVAFHQEYLKLFYLNGYGLLSLFPTTFIPSKRGYNNDNVVLQALWSLVQNSRSPLEKTIYRFAMVYTWLLSFPYYNGFLTGLVHETTGLIPESYRQRCLNYLTADGWSSYSRAGWTETSMMKSLPLPPQFRNNGEFGPIDEDQEIGRIGGYNEYVSVLGWLASYVLIKQSLKGEPQ